MNTRFALHVVVILALALGFSACDGRNPVGPSGSGTFDPDKPIDENNRPPGPGAAQKATFDYAVYGYDCAATPDSCDSAKRLAPVAEQVQGRETYEVNLGSSHTVVMCVNHPGVPAVRLAPGFGRTISLSASAGVRSVSGRDFFYEGDETNRGVEVPGSNPKRYRKCVASSLYNNYLSDNFGWAKGTETGGDLIFQGDATRVDVTLAFRITVIRNR